MNIETVALKGNHEWYEDQLVLNDELACYGVIDGATSMYPYRGKNGETGAYLAAQIVKQAFEQQHNADKSLKDIAIYANNTLKEEMLKANIDVSDPAALWSCALACVQIKENSVDFVQVADCMIIAKYSNGDIRVLTRDQVAIIDQYTLSMFDKYKSEDKYSLSDISAKLKPIHIANKQRANKLNGYTVMNGQDELVPLLELGTINRNGLSELYIMSDGLFLPDYYIEHEEQRWTKIIEYIDKLTLSGYVNWLVEEEVKDSSCTKHRRLKISDDKTAIKIIF